MQIRLTPEHSVVCEFHFKAEDFEAKAVHSIFVKYLFNPFPGGKGLTT